MVDIWRTSKSETDDPCFEAEVVACSEFRRQHPEGFASTYRAEQSKTFVAEMEFGRQ